MSLIHKEATTNSNSLFILFFIFKQMWQKETNVLRCNASTVGTIKLAHLTVTIYVRSLYTKLYKLKENDYRQYVYVHQ